LRSMSGGAVLRRVAIVNRGEAAMRLIHAVRELNARTGGAIETVALHTDGERAAMFAREADHTFNLGPAADRPYLNHALLERALVETGADAAWVGWGFVAEDAEFARLCERIGVVFIGPSPEAMLALGDKIGAKLIAERVGVPVAAWSSGAVDDLPAAVVQFDEVVAEGGAGISAAAVDLADDDLCRRLCRDGKRDEGQRARESRDERSTHGCLIVAYGASLPGAYRLLTRAARKLSYRAATVRERLHIRIFLRLPSVTEPRP